MPASNLPPNTDPILYSNKNLNLDEGNNATIPNSLLRTEDADGDAITYTLTALPAHGTLKLNGTALNLSGNKTFTQADIDSNRLTYTHDGTKSTSDSFSFTATDGKGGNISPTTFNITVSPYNHAPTDITLSKNSIAENSPTGTVIADLSAIDLNKADTHTYKLYDTVGGRFTIDGNKLKVANGSLFDFETLSSYNIFLQATDSGTPNKISSWKPFTITLTNVNEAPTVANAISNQTTTAGSAFSYQLASNTFTDVDAGDTLTYSATLANGSPLPSWLSFNSATGTFTGTPTNSNAGNLSLQVRATDKAGASASTPFNLTVNPGVNYAPTDITLSKNSIAENSPTGTVIGNLSAIDPDSNDSHTYTLLNNAGGRFSIDGNKLKVANGSLLNFESATSHTIRVRTTDIGGKTFEKDLTLGVTNVNEAPTVSSAIPTQTTGFGNAFSYQLASNTFTDVDAGDTLTYSATLANGSPLPSWLSFNPATRTFSGTPTVANANAGNLSLKVSATDKAGASASTPFNLGVINHAPVLKNPLFLQGVQWTKNYHLKKSGKFTFASNTFTDSDPGDSLTYTANWVHGFNWNWQNVSGWTNSPVLLSAAQKTPLPNTIQFDSATRTFTISPALRGDIWIEVKAIDKAGATAKDLFHIYNVGRGLGIDNYISGGTAFFDANKNGVQDAGEPFATTTENGEFDIDINFDTFDTNQNGSLDPEEGRIVVTGGTDVATGLPLATPITALPDSFVVTMLTSVVADLVDRGLTPDEAQTKLKSALSLPADLDLAILDPVAATNSNEPGGAQVFSAMIKAQNTVTQIVSLLDGASSASVSQLTQAAVGAIATQIQTDQPLDLSGAATLDKLIREAATKAQQIDPNLNLQAVLSAATQAAQIMAESNQSIDKAAANNTGSNITKEVARAQVITLGEITKDLQEVTAGTKTIEQAVAENTGAALDSQILAAKPAAGQTLTGTAENDTLYGSARNDSIDGGAGSDTIIGLFDSDTITGGRGNDVFVIRRGDGADIITDFAGVGRGGNPSQATIAAADILQFDGAGLTASNMLLTQNGADLTVSFEGVPDTSVTLKNFALENLDNILKSTGSDADLGNILFDGETENQDGFDVINSELPFNRTIYQENTTTFLNDLNNFTHGFDNSSDTINGQGGNDTLSGLSGDDVLRGGAGDDLLNSGLGNDTLIGGSGRDLFSLGKNNGSETITDFEDGTDLMALRKGFQFSELSITSGSTGTNICLASTGEVLMFLQGVESNLIGAQDFTPVW
ncbi:putative Ig domain-containing protein [Kamptonema formosum]|uniref:putative Ig domain-containing protein n=1 Tax=Kamptonema formosum TaxID=331992 RepID=UPI000345E955|nr:putative Ig domain-containing protein [Oscillatoria sp. PCC 10802]